MQEGLSPVLSRENMTGVCKKEQGKETWKKLNNEEV